MTGAWRYARGLAFVATGRRGEAEAELAARFQKAWARADVALSASRF